MREKCPLLDSISRLPRLHASASRPTIACAGFAEQYLSSSVGPRIAYGKLQAESCSAHLGALGSACSTPQYTTSPV
jgi:hypothetical protein